MSEDLLFGLMIIGMALFPGLAILSSFMLIKSLVKEPEKLGLAFLCLIISTVLGFACIYLGDVLKWELFSYSYEHKYGSFKHPDRFTETRTRSVYFFNIVALFLFIIGPFIVALLIEKYFLISVKKRLILYVSPIFIICIYFIKEFFEYLSNLNLQ